MTLVTYKESVNRIENLFNDVYNLDTKIYEIASPKPNIKNIEYIKYNNNLIDEQSIGFFKKNLTSENFINKEYTSLKDFKFILPEPKASSYAPCGEVPLGELEQCTLGVEIPQVSKLYGPIKVVRKQALGRLRFGETERSNIILDTMDQLFNYAAQHGRDLTWHLDDAKIEVTGPKVDRVFFETSDGVISGSIVYLRNSLLTRDKIRTVVHFNSETERDMNEYFGLHKILLELNSKKHSNKEVVIPFAPKKYEGKGQAPAAI